MNAFLDSLDALKLTFDPHIAIGSVMSYDVRDFMTFLSSRFFLNPESNDIPAQLYGVADDLNGNINRLFTNIEANYPSLDQGTVIVLITLIQSDGDVTCREALNEVVRRYMAYVAAELVVTAAAAAVAEEAAAVAEEAADQSSDSD
jgi:hypothetical protein